MLPAMADDKLTRGETAIATFPGGEHNKAENTTDVRGAQEKRRRDLVKIISICFNRPAGQPDLTPLDLIFVYREKSPH